MGTVTRPDRWHRPHPTRSAASKEALSNVLDPNGWIMAAAVLAPVAVAAILIPWRSTLDTADNALFLVVIIVAVAGTGRRGAAATAALVSAISFDFFLTRPYYSFRITRHQDLITEILLLALGLAVGELAARGRRHRDEAWESRHQVAQLHWVTELAASGQEPQTVLAAATDELRELLSLRGIRFTEHEHDSAAARLTPSGEVRVGSVTWPTSDIGLPTQNVDLPVRSGGWVLGHFHLTPTPGKPVPSDRLLVAVSIADQVGAALAAEDSTDGPRTSGGPTDDTSEADLR